MTALARHSISVKPSLVQGYGVFADADILEGEIIEECYVLFIPHGTLKDYVFYIADEERYKDFSAFALGYGSIYNHSTKPNAKHLLNAETQRLTITASRNIKCGEELYIYYGDEWFSHRRISITQESLWFKFKYFFRSRIFRRGILVTLALILFVVMLHG